MPTDIRSDAHALQHDNYNAAVAPATKTPTIPADYLLVQNMDATDNVLISFDGGTNYKTIKPGQSLSMDVNRVKSYKVKSSANTPAVECLYGSEG